MDTLVLTVLSRGRLIGKKRYWVHWDIEKGCAFITYANEGETPTFRLCDKDDNRINFHSELAAHGYLENLAQLVHKERNYDWKDL